MGSRNGIVLIGIGVILPVLTRAQDGLAGEVGGLQGVLDSLYKELLPQCSALIGVARGIAGFAALWYIAVRVWRHLTRAEPIDVFPLLRPFVLGFMILLFPLVINLINGVMQPVETGTADLVKNSNAALAAMLQAKQDALKNTDPYQWYVGPTGSGDEDLWEKYSGQADSGTFSVISNAVKFAINKNYYNFHNSVKQWIREILEVLYEAAALAINTMRCFNLLVLAILGPLVFGLSVFDGFHHVLINWLARYVKIFLWLPVANIFGWIISNIQVKMVALDISQVQTAGHTFFGPTDAGYLVFLVIAIIGYFTVPSVAGYIVQVGSNGMHLVKTTGVFSSLFHTAASVAGGAGGWTAGRAWRGAGNIIRAPVDFMDGYNANGDNASGTGYNRTKDAYEGKKLRGD